MIEAETSIDQSELRAAHPANYPNLLEDLKTETMEFDKKNKNIPIKLQSIDTSLNDINIDNTRIVDSSVNLSVLQEYVPASKIKGLFN